MLLIFLPYRVCGNPRIDEVYEGPFPKQINDLRLAPILSLIRKVSSV